MDISAEGRSADRAGRRDTDCFVAKAPRKDNLIFAHVLTEKALSRTNGRSCPQKRRSTQAKPETNEQKNRCHCECKRSNPSPRKNVQTGTGGAGVRWTPLPKAEAPTEPAGETRIASSLKLLAMTVHFMHMRRRKRHLACTRDDVGIVPYGSYRRCYIFM